jgi:hypothetical protein
MPRTTMFKNSQSAPEDQTEILEIALCKSLVLQNHYATLLNDFDGGNRLTFATAADWIERLRLIGTLKD